MDQKVIESLKSRYAYLHPIIFRRSVEKAKTLGELFDILDSCPKDKYPIVWEEETRQWVYTDDLFQSSKFKE